jgi:hypothetical protein
MEPLSETKLFIIFIFSIFSENKFEFNVVNLVRTPVLLLSLSFHPVYFPVPLPLPFIDKYPILAATYPISYGRCYY